MSDLSARLRDRAGKYDEYAWHGDIELEAAAALDRLIEALTWYADKQNYGSRVCNDGDDHYDVLPSEAEEDRGELARTALVTLR